MTPPPALRVRDLLDLATLRLRQVPGYDAAQLFPDQPGQVRRHLICRVDRAMVTDSSADEAPPERFARFVALPRRLRRETRRVAAELPRRRPD